ncbi:MAG TPA: Rieske (2Fe-2S) protein [Gemmatimonadales bacterium]|nr:Rieske (2Fe-2S) protein [Gemmatimonadales bacterium]
MNDEHQARRGILRRLASMIAALLTARAVRAAFARRRARAIPATARKGEDPSRRELPRNRRAEALVALLLVCAGVFAFGFTVVYVAAGASTQLLGLALGGALALVAAAAIVAGKAVVPQETSVEERGVLLDEQEVGEVIEIVESGGEGISRRGLLAGAAGLAGAGVLTAAVTPLASLGPDLDAIHQTPWRRGVRLVDDQGRPYSAADVQIGAFYNALPEHGEPDAFGSGLLVVKLPPDLIHLPAARRAWAPEGILAYSKICPHAGCAISLYRYPTYQPTSVGPAFTCPCHYSTFSPGEGWRVMFGPAGRALPQLPLMIDGEGNLRAAAGFHEDIGPSWWSVRRSQS